MPKAVHLEVVQGEVWGPINAGQSQDVQNALMTHDGKANGGAIRGKSASQISDQDAMQREQGKPILLCFAEC